MYFKTTAFLYDTMRKSKEITKDIRKSNVELHKSGSSMGNFFQIIEGSSVQTVIHKNRHDGNGHPSYRSGRKQVL